MQECPPVLLSGGPLVTYITRNNFWSACLSLFSTVRRVFNKIEKLGFDVDVALCAFLASLELREHARFSLNVRVDCFYNLDTQVV